MDRLLPSLDALRIFAVAARHESFSAAAAEIHVTHGAVSQRIKQLQAELGVNLFERSGNKMLVTPEGRVLLQERGACHRRNHAGRGAPSGSRRIRAN